MELLNICPKCQGTGGDGNPDTTDSCAFCQGVGKVTMNIVIPELDDLKNTVDDIMNKCNDIFDAVEALE